MKIVSNVTQKLSKEGRGAEQTESHITHSQLSQSVIPGINHPSIYANTSDKSKMAERRPDESNQKEDLAKLGATSGSDLNRSIKQIASTRSESSNNKDVELMTIQFAQLNSLFTEHDSSRLTQDGHNLGKMLYALNPTTHEYNIEEGTVKAGSSTQAHSSDLDLEVKKLHSGDPAEVQQALSKIGNQLPHLKPGAQIKTLSYLADSLGVSNKDVEAQKKIVELIEKNYTNLAINDFQTKFYAAQVVKNLSKVLANGVLDKTVDTDVADFLTQNMYCLAMENDEQNSVMFDLKYARDNGMLSSSAKELLTRSVLF